MASPITVDSAALQSSNVMGQMTSNYCSVCSKHFDRKDSLTRHMRIHERINIIRPRRKACVPCIRTKLKCLREQPSCSTCEKRRVECIYDSPSHGSRGKAQKASEQDAHRSHAFKSRQPILPPLSNNDASGPAGGSTATSSQMTIANELPTAHSWIDNASLVSPADLGIDLQSQLPYTPGWGDLFFPDLGVDSLSHEIAGPSGDYQSACLGVPNLLSQPLNLSGSEETSYFLGSHLPSHTLSRLLNLPISTASKTINLKGGWPVDWLPESAELTALPTLGKLGEEPQAGRSFYSSPNVNSSTRTCIEQGISLSHENSPWQTLPITDLPSNAILDRCIDLYFEKFDWSLPFIHIPTFDPSKELVVTLAVACLGAGYTEFKNARAFSSSLSEITRRLLLFLAEHDPNVVRSEGYITASLLQCVHGVISGDRRLYELSKSRRTLLINSAKYSGLFSYQPCEAPSEGNLEERWYSWIKHERLCRLGWAIYEFDTLGSYFHNSPPSISVNDIHMRLPCSSEHWQADSPHAWAALHPWTQNIPSMPMFQLQMQKWATDELPATEHLPDEAHSHIAVLTLIRSLYNVNEIRLNPVLTILQGISDFQSTRRVILQFMHRFLEPLSSPNKVFTDREFAQRARRMQTIHMAYVYSSGLTSSWLYSLVRNDSSRDAKARLKEWAEQDQLQLREVLYHSAQTLSIVRQYPYNIPMEAFHAFHSGLLLWALSEVLPIPPRYPSQYLRLDQLPGHDPVSDASVATWVQHGGRQVLGMYCVPDLGDPVAGRQILEQTAGILRRMRVFGIPQIFADVVLRLLQDTK